MSKGSHRRPAKVAMAEFDDRYDRIFGQKKVQRGRFIWSVADDCYLPADEYHEKYGREVNAAPMVMGDVEPFVSPIDKAVISSRSHKRAHMQRHGVIEVGNEKLSRPATKPYKPAGLKEDLVTTYRTLKHGSPH